MLPTAKFFSRMFCRHYKVIFCRNIYGDEINHRNGMRSLWQCAKCGAIVLSEHLHHTGEQT